MPKPGTFIVLEGSEGAGKSSVVDALKELLPQNEFLFTYEPGGTEYAEAVGRRFLEERDQPTNPFEQLLAVTSARSHHVRHVIKPALTSGIHVVCDRWVASTYAYQVHNQDLPSGLWPELGQLATYGVRPDVWIFLDVEPEVGRERTAARDGKPNIFDEADVAFHTRVREGFQHFFTNLPNSCWIDTTEVSLEEVIGRVQEVIVRACMAQSA